MSEKEFRKIALDNRPQKLPIQTKLVSASATGMQVVGVYNLKLNIFGKELMHPIHVCRNLNQKAIVGIDLIEKLGLNYLAKAKVFVFDSNVQFNPSQAFQNETIFKKDKNIITYMDFYKQFYLKK